MTKAAAIDNLLTIIRRYLDRMPWFVAEAIRDAMRKYEEAE